MRACQSQPATIKIVTALNNPISIYSQSGNGGTEGTGATGGTGQQGGKNNGNGNPGGPGNGAAQGAHGLASTQTGAAAQITVTPCRRCAPRNVQMAPAVPLEQAAGAIGPADRVRAPDIPDKVS